MVLGGRRHRRRHGRRGRRRRGGSLKSIWNKVKSVGSKAFHWAKDHKIASKIAREFGKNNIADGLETMGFGRRRRRHHRRGSGRLPYNGGRNSANQQQLLGAYLRTKVAKM